MPEPGKNAPLDDVRLNRAATLAARQLEYAEAVLALARPAQAKDSALLGALLQAIAINYAVMARSRSVVVSE